MSVPENKGKRAGKRYSYPRAAQCEFESQIFEIQILNISSSGIQFAVRVRIETQKSLRVQWKDTQFGNFDINILLAREVHKPENKEFQYYYGSQYYNLSTDAKERLINLLKHFKAEEQKLNQLQIEKSTPQYIFDVIDQGASFLRRAFNGGDPDPYFENILKQIVDYEKTAFMMEDPVSLAIQKSVTHNFHCNLLGILAVQIAETEGLKSTYFETVKVELEKIAQVENEVEEVSKNIPAGGLNGEEKMNIQRRLNESSNRLFYTKQSLLQSLVETFSADEDNPVYKESFDKIKDEYEKILEFTGSSDQIESLTYKRRTKDTSDEKIKDVIDVPIMSQKKPSTTLWLGGIFLFVLGAIFVAFKAVQLKDKESFKDKIGIGIEVQSFKKFGSQVEIRIDAAKWRALPNPKKEEVFQKIVKFLQDDKNSKSCIIFDSNLNIIHILYEEALPGNLKVTPEELAAPEPAEGQKPAPKPATEAPSPSSGVKTQENPTAAGTPSTASSPPETNAKPETPTP